MKVGEEYEYPAFIIVHGHANLHNYTYTVESIDTAHIIFSKQRLSNEIFAFYKVKSMKYGDKREGRRVMSRGWEIGEEGRREETVKDRERG